MYCNHCGAVIAETQTVCPSCGKSVIEGRVSYVARSRVAEHLHLLGILWIVSGVFWAIAAAVMLIMGRVFVFRDGPWFLPLLFSVIGTFLVVFAAARLAAGYGLLKVLPWGRTLALVLAFISLFDPPFGTALGIYTLFILLPHAAGDQYRRMSDAANSQALTTQRTA
jgi:hypothetical protein